MQELMLHGRAWNFEVTAIQEKLGMIEGVPRH
jgi:hypothetical protein